MLISTQGLLTLVIGLSAFVLMPAGPCQTANWARGKKGWFTEREEEIIVNRVIRDDPQRFCIQQGRFARAAFVASPVGTTDHVARDVPRIGR